MPLMIALVMAAASAPAQSQSDLNGQTANDLMKADAAMNVQYRATMAAMRKMDEYDAPDAKSGPSYRQALLTSQRAWLTFRDAECVVEGNSFRGGSGQNMAVASCKATLTRQRTAQLKAAAQ